MADLVHTISAPRVVSTITVRVRFAAVACLRIRAAAQIMRFAALVAGCGVAIEMED